MNKSELITNMAEKSGLTKKESEVALKAFIESVEEALGRGEKSSISWIWNFLETRERAARMGRNPRTKRRKKFLLQKHLFSKQEKNSKT